MNSKDWDSVVLTHNNSKIYHLYDWGILLNEVHNHKVIYLAESDGVFPLALVKSHIFGDRLISLPFADYGGLCCYNEKIAEKLVSECQEIAQESGMDFIEVRCPGNQYFDMFSKQGFVRRDDYVTFILTLGRTIEELWRGIGDKNRNMVRRAESRGVQVTEARNKADLKAFYLLYRKTMKKLGSPPQPYKFFERIWSLFYPEHLLVLTAMHDTKCIASGIFFLHNGIIHHAYGCSLRESLDLAPNNLIQWQVIKWGNEQGFKQFDFGRTRRNDGNVLFKRRWGGELVNMPYFYKFYKRELKERQEVKYKSLSRLWSEYMPESIASKVGPWLIKQIG